MNTSNQAGSHRVSYYQTKNDIIYFDSYAQITPLEIQRYLQKGSEFDRGKEVIQRNTYIVQANTPVCGHLILKSLTSGEQIQTILNHMRHYGGYTLERYRINEKRALYHPLHLQLDSQDYKIIGK